MSEAQTVDIKELLAELIACAGVFDVSTEYEADKAELEKATQAVLQYTQALCDERDRLRDELDIYRQAVQYVFEAINKFDDIQRKKAALTPAGGGKDE